MNSHINGHTNGYTNGSLKGDKKVNGGMNGHTITPRRTPPVKTRPSFFARIFSITARLLTWYSIFTLLFRCPAGLDACDETSPKICKPYFQVKQAVSPHLTPYYDTYAAPYVDLAKPYYNKVDQVIVNPARTYAVKYGGPQLTKAQALGQARWEKNVQPQLAKYQTLAKTHYDQSVAPHVNKASTTVAPYYDIARTNALQTYHEIITPSYLFVQPYALRSYDAASSFTTKTAVPSTLWAWNKTYLFVDSTVWPHFRDVYVVKVEPQLLRIIERLSRYKEIKPKSSVVEEVEEGATQASKSTFTKPSASISSTTALAETTSESEPTASLVEAGNPEPAAGSALEQETGKPTKEQIRETAAKEVAADLELWQGKFTTAADQGASEIEERIEELANRMMEQEAHVTGKSLVSELNSTVNTELAGLKKEILSILEKHKDATQKDRVAGVVRGTGLNIKNKAQDIRTWRESYEEQMETDVTKAAQEHIKILEGIRDLALQKIGMKWAWMDGVTYKHWQQFHVLRENFDVWVEDLKHLVITHPGLAAAQTAGNDVESEGMSIAAEAAQELSKLKQVAAWKASAGDLSDDFSVTTMKLAAETAEKKAAEAAQVAAEALKSATEDVEAGVHSVADKVESRAGSVSQALSEGVSSVIIPESASTTTVGSDETETVTLALAEADGKDTETSAVPPLESMASEPTHRATNLASDSATSKTPVADKATNAAEPVEPLPTVDPVDGPEQVDETIVASPENPSSSAGSATPTVKYAMFGAAAASAPSRQPILDEDIGSSLSSAASVVQSDVPHTITSAAQSAYTAAIARAADQYSRAMSAVSVQISGEPKPAHEEMLSSVSSGYFAALGSANSRLNEALTAASEGIYGTPTAKWVPDLPTIPSIPSVDWEKVQSIAQQNLQDSVSWAGEQYENAKVAIGAAEPTPSTTGERAQKLMDQAKHNYYAGLGVAHARYSEFLSAASTAVSSMTATPTPTDIQGSASSVASVASDSASSAASVVSDSASSAASVASEAAASVASTVGDAATNAGDSIVENWDFLVSRVSSQIYGAPTPTPWYENLYAAAGGYASQAGDYAASATGAAGDYVSQAGDYAAYATEAAGDYADSASSAAASQYSVVQSIISELIVGKEPTFSESVYSRLAGAYGAVSATAASAASEVTASAASAASAASDTISSATDKVKEGVEYLRDEL
ncbi:hypothetical protein BJ170DRAFT_594129 [Xylariales sp. AK1849]|nr:hypothetical protein BJ170DRAFT_594129 [Xylariales sp. AK1849]